MTRSSLAPILPVAGVPFPARRTAWLLIAIAIVVMMTLGAMGVVTLHTVKGHLRALHPKRIPVERAHARELGQLIDVSFRTSDGLTLRGWYHPSENRAAVILAHGGGATREQVLPEASILARRGYGVLLFDFRAHGESEGDTCTWGGLEQRDIEAALDYAVTRKDIDPERIGALGLSFGGGPVIEVAARDVRIKAVVTEGTTPTLVERLTLDSGRFRAFTALPSIWAVGRQINLDAARPVDHVCAIHPRPILIISGDEKSDQPLPLAREIYDAACEPKEFWQVLGAGHVEYARVAHAELEARLIKLFDRALLGPKPPEN